MVKALRYILSISLLLFSLQAEAQTDSNTVWLSDSMKAVLVEVRLDYSRIKGNDGNRIACRGDSLLDFQAFNLAEALKQNTELFVRSYGSNGIATLSVRGTSSNHNKVYWNGLDISPPNLALMDLSLLQSKPWESLEVDFGAGSLPLGSGSIGAALNLNTQWSKGGKNKLYLRAGAGSFGRQEYQAWTVYGKRKLRAQTSVSFHQLENNYPYRIPGQEARDQELQNADFQQIHLEQALNYRLKPEQFISSNIWYTQTKRSLPRIQLTTAGLFDRMTDENLFWNNEYQKQYVDQKLIFKAQVGLVASSNRFQLAGSDSVDQNNYQSYQAQFRLKTMQRHWLDAEIAFQSRNDRVQSNGYNQDAMRWLNALYGTIEFDLPNADAVNLQLRSELYDDQFAPLTGSLTWRIGGFHLEPHLSISRNYRVPSLNDLYWDLAGNIDLEPEESYQLNFGLDYKIEGSNWKSHWELHSYYMWVDNWIQWTPVNNIWRPLNLKSVQNYGADFIWKLRFFTGKWRYGADINYQILFNQIISNSVNPQAEGNQLPYNPGHSLNFNPQVYYKKWRLAYSLNFTDRYYLDEGNQYYLPGYILQDLQLSYGKVISNHYLKLSFSVHNLGDIDYQTIAWRPEAGINYRLGIEWRLWEKD